MPSAKALGKRRVVQDAVVSRKLTSILNFTIQSDIGSDDPAEPCDLPNKEKAELPGAPWNSSVRYVYDAAAERTQQRIKGHIHTAVNGINYRD